MITPLTNTDNTLTKLRQFFETNRCSIQNSVESGMLKDCIARGKRNAVNLNMNSEKWKYHIAGI